MSKIVITRASEWVNRRRKFILKLDGQHLTDIKNDQILEFNVSPGRHVLWAKIDWAGSEDYEFDMADGETKYFKISTFKHANWLVPAGSIFFFLYILVLRNIFDLRDTVWEKVFWVILLFYLGVFLYYLTLGRKRYLWLRQDDN